MENKLQKKMDTRLALDIVYCELKRGLSSLIESPIALSVRNITLSSAMITEGISHVPR